MSSMFFEMLADQTERETVEAGVKAMVAQYYANYTDADCLEPNFIKALEVVTDNGNYLVHHTLEDLVGEAEAELAEKERRTVSTFPKEEDK